MRTFRLFLEAPESAYYDDPVTVDGAEVPFRCETCEYWRPNNEITCGKPEVQADPKAHHGRVKAHGCCKFWDRADRDDK